MRDSRKTQRGLSAPDGNQRRATPTTQVSWEPRARPGRPFKMAAAVPGKLGRSPIVLGSGSAATGVWA